MNGSPHSKKIRLELRNLLFILVGAVIFSFLMGVLANLVVNHFTSEASTSELVCLTVIIVVVSVVIAYALYYCYVFIPHSRTIRKIHVPIIYNRKDGFVIADPFDGYFPQQMAWQTFKRFKEKFPDEAKNGIKEGIPISATKKHLLTELLEYLIILKLRDDEELYGFGGTGLTPDKTIAKLPYGLEKNTFVRFFRSSESKDIVDQGMSQLEFNLPKNIAIKYRSPTPIKGSLSDLNTFRIDFVGKYCEICLTGQCTSLSPIRIMRSGPSPVFESVYIRRYFQEKLMKDLGGLWRITFDLTIEDRFKLRYFLYPPLKYMEWAERWVEGFIKGTFFGGFDFKEFRKEKLHSMEYDLYDTVKTIDVRLEEMERIISTMKNNGK